MNLWCGLCIIASGTDPEALRFYEGGMDPDGESLYAGGGGVLDIKRAVTIIDGMAVCWGHVRRP